MKRRTFNQLGGAAVAAGFAAPTGFAQNRSKPTKSLGANEKIIVGAIGVGNRGTQVLRDFMAHDDVEIAALCDLDSAHLTRARAEVVKAERRAPKDYHDFRKMIEAHPELDAVIVATPDHWHALPTIHALEAGMDVYVEKPLSHSYVEGRKMVEAAQRNKRVTQMGIQIHNHPSRNFAKVAATVQSGLLGKITKVRCWKADRSAGFGHPPDADPPASLDYDFWLGPAPERPYNPNRSHFNFRYFFDYAGGQFSDFSCHINDVAFSSLGLGAAKSAAAAGGKFALDDNTETPDTLEVVYEYDDLSLVWSQTMGNASGFYGLGGIGCVFQGTDATLATNYETHKIFAADGSNTEIEKPEHELPPHVSHSREFLDSVKSRKQPSCNIEYGHALTTNVHLGNISYRTGTKVVWNAKKEKIVGNSKANALLSRKYRKPWKL